jgi:hypothetical protein
MANMRTRWAAIGAAIAITIGAGGVGLVDASVGSGERTVFVPITPCRVMDTRPDSTVGPKSSPLGPSETHTVTAHGDNGDCVGIPADAVALSLNITTVGATMPSFLTIWEAGQPQPGSSSLNPVPGEPPTPNGVTTALSPAGQFSLFNFQGAVDVIADITGYYVDHNHDDRYYTKSEIDTLVLPDAASLPVSGRCNADQTAPGEALDGQYENCTGDLTIGSSTPHSVLLVAQIGWGDYQVGNGTKGECRLQRNGIPVPGSTVTFGSTIKTTEESNAGGIINRRLNYAGVTAVSGPHTDPGAYSVGCRELFNDMQFNEISVSAIVTSGG